MAAVFSPGLSYMGQSAAPFLTAVVQTQTSVVLTALSHVAFGLLVIAFYLACATFALSWWGATLSGLFFSASAVIRTCVMYPAVASAYGILKGQPELLLKLSSVADPSPLRLALEWGPFLIFAASLFFNTVQILRNMILQNERLKAARRALVVEEFERESRRMAMGAVAIVIGLVLGSIGLFRFPSFLDIHLPQNTQTSAPNVFIFGIDSLRTDRVFSSEHEHVVPFLRTKSSAARFRETMLVGVPRTFPSWVELATCQYGTRNGVRTMFPSKQIRATPSVTVFEEAQTLGYNTVFVSDFAGDIFKRYPFGAKHIEAPNSNLQSLVENSIIQNIPTLQSILLLPRMHRLLDSILETPSIADPRLLVHAIADVIENRVSGNEPLFLTTFFSQAHFPYAAPAPFFKLFQKPNAEGMFLYKKEADQALDPAAEIPEVSHEQVRSLYDASLFVTDKALERLWNELEAKGWLANAMVIVLGDHGENLYEGKLGMGHGDEVSSEYSTTTPLIIWTFGKVDEQAEQSPTHTRIVRTVDVAPTIARRLNFKMDLSQCDGLSLLDPPDKVTSFPRELAYQESGVWFTPGEISPAGFERVNYPGIIGLLDLDATKQHEFALRQVLSSSVLSAKERAWVGERYRLVARNTKDGVQFSLYDREADPAAQNDLLKSKQNEELSKLVSREMIRQLEEYLQSQGVEMVTHKQNSHFYVDPATK